MENKKRVIAKLSEFYKVLGDTTRLNILYTLLNGEKCVSEICEQLQMNQSAISHQLKILRLYDLVKKEKKGQSVFYSVTDNHVIVILEYGFNHMEEIINKF